MSKMTRYQFEVGTSSEHPATAQEVADVLCSIFDLDLADFGKIEELHPDLGIWEADLPNYFVVEVDETGEATRQYNEFEITARADS